MIDWLSELIVINYVWCAILKKIFWNSVSFLCLLTLWLLISCFPSVWFHHNLSITFQTLMQLSFCSDLSLLHKYGIWPSTVTLERNVKCVFPLLMWNKEMLICRYLIMHIYSAWICLYKQMNTEMSVSLHYICFNVVSSKVTFEDYFLIKGEKKWVYKVSGTQF